MSDSSMSGSEATLGPSTTTYSKNEHTGRLFDRIAPHYNLLAEAFSFWQTSAWRRYLVSRLSVGPGDTVLDICTGTAIVALKIAKTSDARVVGVDLSEGMLRLGQRNVSRAGLGKQRDLASR